MDNNYLVDIQHERLSFFTPAGEVKALNDVSIHLKEGEVLGIVGESGSGKSVTAYSLMGLTAYPGKLIGGELHFNGHEVEKMTENYFPGSSDQLKSRIYHWQSDHGSNPSAYRCGQEKGICKSSGAFVSGRYQ
jgi:ABC-type dipeptide/oligopeptide/nickel transport system ATPase component